MLSITSVTQAPEHNLGNSGYTIYDAEAEILSQACNWDFAHDVTFLGTVNVNVALDVRKMEAFACVYSPVIDSIEMKLHPGPVKFEKAKFEGRPFCETVGEQFEVVRRRFERQLLDYAPDINVSLPGRLLTNKDELGLIEQLAQAAKEIFPKHSWETSIADSEYIEPHCEHGNFETSLYASYKLYDHFRSNSMHYEDFRWRFPLMFNQNFIDILDCAKGRKVDRFGWM